jgi:hypothetical protein
LFDVQGGEGQHRITHNTLHPTPPSPNQTKTNSKTNQQTKPTTAHLADRVQRRQAQAGGALLIGHEPRHRFRGGDQLLVP